MMITLRTSFSFICTSTVINDADEPNVPQTDEYNPASAGSRRGFMAGTISWDSLRELAAFQAQQGCAISLYLDLDPSISPTAGDVQSRVNSLLDELREDAEGRGLTHAQREGLKADIDRIRRYLEQEFSREGAHGLAVFCAGLDNFWKPLALTDSVPDAAEVGREFYLAPLVPRVVVVCSEETKAEFAELLPSEARAAVVGWTHAEAHAKPSKLLALVRPVLEEWRQQEERAAIDRWREEAGRNGRAA